MPQSTANTPICVHCAIIEGIRCDAEHCDVAGPVVEGKFPPCYPCWVRLGKPNRDGPGIARKAWNFAIAAFHHIRRGLPTVSEEVARKRLDACEACREWFDAERRMCRRPECGCAMDQKVTWAEQKCPIGRWPAEV